MPPTDPAEYTNNTRILIELLDVTAYSTVDLLDFFISLQTNPLHDLPCHGPGVLLNSSLFSQEECKFVSKLAALFQLPVQEEGDTVAEETTIEHLTYTGQLHPMGMVKVLLLGAYVAEGLGSIGEDGGFDHKAVCDHIAAKKSKFP